MTPVKETSMRRIWQLFAILMVFAGDSAWARESHNSRSVATIYIAEWSKLRHQAESGDVNAQFQLANFYLEPPEDTTLPQSYNKAAQFYRLAAMQGHASAQHNLGVLLAKGLGVDKNWPEARAWFQLASERGLMVAKQALASLDRSMNAAEKAESDLIAAKLRRKIR